jgi:hypothetical protein
MFANRAAISLLWPSRMAAAAPFFAVDRGTITRICRTLRHRIFDSYRPELHYMRGPGPKWREKHVRDHTTALDPHSGLNLSS